jgi:hypothetical protein
VAWTLAVLGADGAVNTALAWSYVGLRMVHSPVHATVNVDSRALCDLHYRHSGLARDVASHGVDLAVSDGRAAAGSRWSVMPAAASGT